MPITHTFVSAKSDGGDATLVRPSDWNANHTGGSNCYESFLTTADVSMASSSTWYSHADLALTPPAGDYLVTACLQLQSASASQTGMAAKIATGGSLSSNVLSGDTGVKSMGAVTPGLSTNDFPMVIQARVTVNGSTAIRAAAWDSRSSDGTILRTANNGGIT